MEASQGWGLRATHFLFPSLISVLPRGVKGGGGGAHAGLSLQLS